MSENGTEEGIAYEISRPIHFSAGLIGLEEWKNYVVMRLPEAGPLSLLQSLEDERLSFILVDPRDIVPGYLDTISASDSDLLRVKQGGATAVYCIVAVPEDPSAATVNLMGPLLIDEAAGAGEQLILTRAEYSTRHPLAPAGGVEEVAGC